MYFLQILRFNLWLATDNTIAQHNKQFGAGLVTFKMGHNFFSDLTEEEKQQRRGLKLPQDLFNQSYLNNRTGFREISVGLPSSVDWRNTLQPIKDQGQCGYEKC